jgi:uncharacterized protein
MASHCHSLKEKRSVVRKLKERVRNRFHVPLSEVGGQDTWQRLVMGFAVVGSDRQTVDRVVTEITRFVDRAGLAELIDETHEIVSYGDEPLGEAVAMLDPAAEGDPMDADWIPESWKDEETS